MGGACYSGLAEGYRQALLSAVYGAARKAGNIHVELESALKAESEFNRIVMMAQKEFSTLTSEEAKEYIVTNVLRLYEDISRSIVQKPHMSLEDIKKDAKEFVKGQSHKNHKGGCHNGRKNKH